MEADSVWIHSEEDDAIEEKKICFSCGSTLEQIEENILKCNACNTIYNYKNS